MSMGNAYYEKTTVREVQSFFAPRLIYLLTPFYVSFLKYPPTRGRPECLIQGHSLSPEPQFYQSF